MEEELTSWEASNDVRYGSNDSEGSIERPDMLCRVMWVG